MRSWRHLWVAFIISFTALSLWGESDSFLSHITSRGFEAVRSFVDFESSYSERLSGVSKGRTDKAEVSSIQHQVDVVKSVRGTLKTKLEKDGFDLKAYHKGVIDSDLGKLKEFKVLLTEKSAKSDRLLSFLKLQGDKKSAKILRELLVRFPAHKRALLNPAFSNDKLRGLFKKHPVLQHYLHELPGMADSLYFFETGIIGENEFRKQLTANMFHNGPHAGFWKSYSEFTIPALVGKDPATKTFFLNTAYEGEKNKKGFVTPHYPGPLSVEGYVHVAFDRLSQGTRGGVDKIFEEIRKFPGQSDVEKIASLLFDNPRGTSEQFSALIDLANEDPNLTDKQKRMVVELVERCQKRLDTYIAYVIKYMEFRVEGTAPVLILKPSEKVSLVFKSDGKKLSIVKSIVGQKAEPERLESPEAFGNELKDKVVKLLLIEEERNGDPLQGLDL